MASVLSKFARGVATAGAQSLKTLGEAEIIAQRDKRLQEYDTATRKDDQAFRSRERLADQDFTQAENDRQRKLTREENQAERDARAREGDANRRLDTERLGIERTRVEAAVKQAEQAIEAGELELEAKRQVQDLRDQALDDTLDAAVRARAVENLETLLGEGGNNYETFTAYGEENEFGEQPRATGILNRRTGTREFISPSGSTGAASGVTNQYDSPYAIRQAYQAGNLTLEEAEALLDQLQQD
jgi:hypothetical protein